MNVIERNQVKMIGRGKKTMVFAHGYGCSQKVWRLVAPRFQDDYRIVLFDHVGSGDSDTSAYDRTKYGTLSGYATDLLEIYRVLELRDTVFVGHSVSAMIGVLAAIQNPALFQSLILVAPSPCYVNEPGYLGGFERSAIEDLLKFLESDHMGWSRVMAPVIMGNSERPELANELLKNFCGTKPAIAQHFAQVTFLSDHRKDLHHLDVPSLILQCSKDPIAPESVGEYLNKNLKDSELNVLKATGHCPHLSAPDETTQAIFDYLRGDALTKKVQKKSAA